MPDRGGRSPIAEAMRFAQGGVVLVAPMLGFGALGYWLDGRWGTGPWLMVAGLLVGMAGGFASFFRLVSEARDGRRGDGGDAGDR